MMREMLPAVPVSTSKRPPEISVGENSTTVEPMTSPVREAEDREETARMAARWDGLNPGFRRPARMFSILTGTDSRDERARATRSI